MTTIDTMLQRRPNEWYVGRAMIVPEDYARGMGIDPGYYRVDSMTANGEWYLMPLDGPPPNEPIYVSDGSRDLKAVPSTVRPPDWEFAAWWLAYLVVVAILVGYSADSTEVALLFWGLVFLPFIGSPFFTWFVNVEPVRGTKMAMVIFGAQGALAIKQHHDRQEMARLDAKIRTLREGRW